jgi:aminopeptidase N
MKHLLFLSLLIMQLSAIAQMPTDKNDWKKIYRSFPEKINNLVHTRLEATLVFERSELEGKATLTLQPHFYPTDSVILDAKGMSIQTVALISGNTSTPLQFKNDGLFLRIKLNRTYLRNQIYSVAIKYIAKPNEFKANGSQAITDAKGLYFINPLGKETNKPTQVWTQGETEGTSVWVPTIDRPNQKSTQEFFLTVPDKMVSLSNGILVSQKKNTNGTRTDYWKMDMPHAPYLFFIGAGDFAVIKDSYKGKEVSYYVDKEYAPVARKIFGLTPEMMKFFSTRVTGIEYPWSKYSQMVAHDYVSGAMENTTATLHGDMAQQDARELTEDNIWETTVAHELFHHWFGDYVTAESWSNLTVNESFANYSQTLWREHKYGKDAGDHENKKDMQTYLRSGGSKKDLVRFFYADKEDMFDNVSYEKGGRILHMLRNFVGDDAFFASLNRYLSDNKLGTGSAHHLRLAFEKVTGKDLNWFFNQWFFGSGHPALDINYGYNDSTKLAYVYIKQTQSGDKIFKLPFFIDIYEGTNKKRQQVWMENKVDTFSFAVNSKPTLINVDGDKVLLCTKKDNKTLAQYLHQFKYAGTYVDRDEALGAALGKSIDTSAQAIRLLALKDPFYAIRLEALEQFQTGTPTPEVFALAKKIAESDPNKSVRAAAIDLLAKSEDSTLRSMLVQLTDDSSYSVAGAALEALSGIDSAAAIAIARQQLNLTTKGRLTAAISGVLTNFGDPLAFDFVAGRYEKLPLSQEKFTLTATLAEVLGKENDPVKFRKGIDLIIGLRNAIPGAQRAQTDPYINNFFLKKIADKKKAEGKTELADYVQKQIEKK